MAPHVLPVLSFTHRSTTHVHTSTLSQSQIVETGRTALRLLILCRAPADICLWVLGPSKAETAGPADSILAEAAEDMFSFHHLSGPLADTSDWRRLAAGFRCTLPSRDDQNKPVSCPRPDQPSDRSLKRSLPSTPPISFLRVVLPTHQRGIIEL